MLYPPCAGIVFVLVYGFACTWTTGSLTRVMSAKTDIDTIARYPAIIKAAIIFIIVFLPFVSVGFGLTVGLQVHFLHFSNLPHPEISILNISAGISLSADAAQDEAG